MLHNNKEDRKANESHSCAETHKQLSFENEEINTGWNSPISKGFNEGLDSSLCFMVSLHGPGLSQVAFLSNCISP